MPQTQTQTILLRRHIITILLKNILDRKNGKKIYENIPLRRKKRNELHMLMPVQECLASDIVSGYHEVSGR